MLAGAAATTAMSGLLTGLLRRYALARRLIDTPGVRSSHSVPTPRGGGAAIVLTFLAGLIGAATFGSVSIELAWAIAGGGGLVAAVGFLDDHGHIAARWRLLAHFVAASWGLMWIGGVPPLGIFEGTVDLGLPGLVLAAVYLVWLLNLYNFMDGIDGIASVEAICVCVGAALLYIVAGQVDMSVLPLLLAAAVLGFLVWNFPPARIFMGDVGSGFLGMVLGLLSLQAIWVSLNLFAGWLILVAVFVTDATWTLLRRLLRGERVYEPHRTHAYQHAAQRCGSHLPVTLCVAAINLIWLVPLALCVGTGLLDAGLGIALAYAPLLGVVLIFRAGDRGIPLR